MSPTIGSDEVDGGGSAEVSDAQPRASPAGHSRPRRASATSAVNSGQPEGAPAPPGHAPPPAKREHPPPRADPPPPPKAAPRGGPPQSPAHCRDESGNLYAGIAHVTQ